MIIKKTHSRHRKMWCVKTNLKKMMTENIPSPPPPPPQKKNMMYKKRFCYKCYNKKLMTENIPNTLSSPHLPQNNMKCGKRNFFYTKLMTEKVPDPPPPPPPPPHTCPSVLAGCAEVGLDNAMSSSWPIAWWKLGRPLAAVSVATIACTANKQFFLKIRPEKNINLPV